MKFVAFAILLVTPLFAADAKKTAAPKKKPAAVAPKVAPVTIPAGATKVDDTTYRFTDNAGKTWLYQKTPFGISRVEQNAATAAAPAPIAEKPADSTPFGKLTSNTQAVAMKVTEKGDSIQFERPTPFGTQRWTRKKSELNEDERALWERQKVK